MERSGARRSDYWRGVGGKIRVRERRGEIERQTAGVRKRSIEKADSEMKPYSAHLPPQGGAVTTLQPARALFVPH